LRVASDKKRFLEKYIVSADKNHAWWCKKNVPFVLKKCMFCFEDFKCEIKMFSISKKIYFRAIKMISE